MTFTTTDYIIGGLFFFYFWRGWCRGFLRAVIGPGAFIVSLLVGILYFDLTQNIPKTLSVIFIGTIAIAIILKIILFIGRQSLNKKDRKYIFIGSRLLGGAINLGYKGTVTMSALFLFLQVPGSLFDIAEYQEPIRTSTAYALFAQRVLPQFPPAGNLLAIMDKVTNPSKTHELIADAEIQQMIKEKNVKDLLTHPKFLKIMRDDKLMRQMTKLSKRLYSNTHQEPPGRDTSTRPQTPSEAQSRQ
jgi:hypothetical protein